MTSPGSNIGTGNPLHPDIVEDRMFWRRINQLARHVDEDGLATLEGLASQWTTDINQYAAPQGTSEQSQTFASMMTTLTRLEQVKHSTTTTDTSTSEDTTFANDFITHAYQQNANLPSDREKIFNRLADRLRDDSYLPKDKQHYRNLVSHGGDDAEHLEKQIAKLRGGRGWNTRDAALADEIAKDEFRLYSPAQNVQLEIDQLDANSAQIGLPGVGYLGPSLPTFSSTSAATDKSPVHRGEYEVELVDDKPHVRIYTAVVNPVGLMNLDPEKGYAESLPNRNPLNPGAKPAQFKDVQQSPTNRKIMISTGADESSVFWIGGGRPTRALAWLTKYEHQYAVTDSHPVLRSFLVPEDAYLEITKDAIQETDSQNESNRTLNVDRHADANQFGVRGEMLETLRAKAVTGSLITYSNNPESVPRPEWAGQIQPTSTLYEKIGVRYGPGALKGTAADPTKYNPWVQATGKGNTDFRFRARDGFESLANELTTHYATFQQLKKSQADPDKMLNRPALMDPVWDSYPGGPTRGIGKGEKPFSKRIEDLNNFLQSQEMAEASDMEKEKFFQEKVLPAANQARIGAIMQSDYQRMLVDFDVRDNLFENNFSEWRTRRNEELELQSKVGDELNKMLAEPNENSAELALRMTNHLIKNFPNLERKFNEVCTQPQKTPYREEGKHVPHQFYEHAQMVLGRYLDLTKNDNPGERFIPVSTMAKAILFHDIEKNNSKNQYDDKNVHNAPHDKEPEHIGAAVMIDRYKGLWDSDFQYRAAKSVVDSDPFGFYLRGKHDKYEVFKFVDELAGKLENPNGNAGGKATPEAVQMLFNEMHQYYQADFSSYTKGSRYFSKEAGQWSDGPNTFNNYFEWTGSDNKSFATSDDGRYARYAQTGSKQGSSYHDKFAELKELFASEATIEAARDVVQHIADENRAKLGSWNIIVPQKKAANKKTNVLDDSNSSDNNFGLFNNDSASSDNGSDKQVNLENDNSGGNFSVVDRGNGNNIFAEYSSGEDADRDDNSSANEDSRNQSTTDLAVTNRDITNVAMVSQLRANQTVDDNEDNITISSDESQGLEPVTVSFAKGSKVLDGPGRIAVQDYADKLSTLVNQRLANGQQPPTVNITGYGNSLLFAGKTGQERADNVANAVTEVLRSKVSREGFTPESIVKTATAGRAFPKNANKAANANRRVSTIDTFGAPPQIPQNSNDPQAEVDKLKATYVKLSATRDMLDSLRDNPMPDPVRSLELQAFAPTVNRLVQRTRDDLLDKDIHPEFWIKNPIELNNLDLTLGRQNEPSVEFMAPPIEELTERVELIRLEETLRVENRIDEIERRRAEILDQLGPEDDRERGYVETLQQIGNALADANGLDVNDQMALAEMQALAYQEWDNYRNMASLLRREDEALADEQRRLMEWKEQLGGERTRTASLDKLDADQLTLFAKNVEVYDIIKNRAASTDADMVADQRLNEIEELEATGVRLPPEALDLANEWSLSDVDSYIADQQAVVNGLKAELLTMSQDGRSAKLAYLPDRVRDELVSDPDFVRSLREALTAEEFAQTAADLMVRVPVGVSQPISARNAARDQIADTLQSPEVAEAALNARTQVVIVPRSAELTSLPQFAHLKDLTTGDGRNLGTVRGVTTDGRQVGLGEEGLLGLTTSVGGLKSHYPDGYSGAKHEMGHITFETALTSDEQRVLGDALNDKLERARIDPKSVKWIDGEMDPSAGEENYGSRSAQEYWAQLTAAWYGANTGKDPLTKNDRNNGVDTVREIEDPKVVAILERVYGVNPKSTPDNPYNQTRAQNKALSNFRVFMKSISPSTTPSGSGNNSDVSSDELSSTNSSNSSRRNSWDNEWLNYLNFADQGAGESSKSSIYPTPPVEYAGKTIKDISELSNIGADKIDFFNKSAAQWKKTFSGKGNPSKAQKDAWMEARWKVLEKAINDPDYVIKANTPTQLKEKVAEYQAELEKIDLQLAKAMSEASISGGNPDNSPREYKDDTVQRLHDKLYGRAFPDSELDSVANKAVEGSTKQGYRYEMEVATKALHDAPKGSKVQLGALPSGAIEAFLGDGDAGKIHNFDPAKYGNKMIGADVVVWKPQSDGTWSADFIQAKSTNLLNYKEKVKEAANQLAGQNANPNKQHTSSDGEHTLTGDGYRGVINVEVSTPDPETAALKGAAEQALTSPYVHEVNVQYLDASENGIKAMTWADKQSAAQENQGVNAGPPLADAVDWRQVKPVGFTTASLPQQSSSQSNVAVQQGQNNKALVRK